MATVPVLSLPIPRDELKKFLPNFQLIKAFENMSQDVSVNLPGGIDGNTEAVELAQATANSAIVQATAAQAAATAAQVDIDALELRAVPLPLTDAPTITVDTSAHNSFSVTLGGNRTLGAPTGLANGMLLNFAVRQDGAGNRTLAFNAIYDFGAAGTPTMSTAAGVTDYIFGYYDSISGKILASFRKGGPSQVASFSAIQAAVQSVNDSTFTKATLGTVLYNVGAAFATSTFTPPAKLVSLVGAVTFPTTAGTRIGCSIYKNGVEFRRGTFIVNGGASNGTAMVSCQDVANGTDTYELWLFQSTGVAQNTLATQTYFMGTTVQA